MSRTLLEDATSAGSTGARPSHVQASGAYAAAGNGDADRARVSSVTVSAAAPLPTRRLRWAEVILFAALPLAIVGGGVLYHRGDSPGRVLFGWACIIIALASLRAGRARLLRAFEDEWRKTGMSEAAARRRARVSFDAVLLQRRECPAGRARHHDPHERVLADYPPLS